MPLRTKAFIDRVISAIREFQSEELMSDRELSLEAWLSPTMVSKIKSWKTIPKLSTIRKLKKIGVQVPKPPLEAEQQPSTKISQEHITQAA